MAYNYSQWVQQLGNWLVIPTTDPNFTTALPEIIDSTEQVIYRGLDLLATIVRDTTGTLTPNSRNFTLPQSIGRFVVTEGFNVFTPANTTTNRNQMVIRSRDYLDAVWPNEAAPSTPSVPTDYAMITDQTIIVGPAPDAGYTVETIGTIRPTPLSATNQTTYLTLYLPDLFWAQSMVIGYAYLKDFAPATDDPQGAPTWASEFKKLWESANTEEMRKKYASLAWTSKQPYQASTPPRA